MASKKNIKTDVKSKTKLKKRKLEKHKRKVQEKKFFYRNKGTLTAVAIIALVLVVSFAGYNAYSSMQEKNSIVDHGDEVKFNFICYYDSGEVIQHTLVTTPSDVTPETDLDSDRLKSPQKLVIGGYGEISGILIPLYWNDGLFIDQKKGETFTLSIPAEHAYGEVNNPLGEDDRLFAVSRNGELDRYGTIGITEYLVDHEEPEVGMEAEINDDSVVIYDIDDENVYYELNYSVGDEVLMEYGSAEVTEITEDKILAYYAGETDVTFYTQLDGIWLPAHIKEASEEELTLEVEHYNYKILIESVDKDVIDQDEWSISDGDFAIVRYIGYFEDGEVFDSSINGDIELTNDLPLDNTYENTPLYITVQPGSTISGTSTVIDGFNNAMKGMVSGEEKTIEVSAEEGYGLYDEDLIESIGFLVGEYDMIETIPKTTTIGVEQYIEDYGKDPLIGDYVTMEYGASMITDVTDGVTVELVTPTEGEFIYHHVKAEIIDDDGETITIEHYPVDGASVYVPNGDVAYVHVDEDTFLVEYDPEEWEIDGYFANGKITEIGDDHLVVDRNHQLAGQTLFFKIRIVDFRKVIN